MLLRKALKTAWTTILVVAMVAASLAQNPVRPRTGGRESIAIVVDRNNPLNSVSSTELREIFFGDRRWWTHDRPITLVAMRPGSAERETILRTIYGMDEKGYEEFFFFAMFRGDLFYPPTDVSTAGELKKFLSKKPGSVGYLRASDVDNTVKVLRVDGLLPDDDGYPLRLRKDKEKKPKSLLHRDTQ